MSHIKNLQQHSPAWLFYSVLVICLTPISLNILGVDFTSFSPRFNITELVTWDLAKGALIDEMFYTLAGGLQHALLEWSSVVIAVVTALVSFVHYRTNRDITVPIIGMALLASGFMDAFHTLAATRLIDSVAQNADLIPFTWALSRGFHAIILIVGVLMVLSLTKDRDEKASKDMTHLALISLLFVGTAYFLIHLSASKEVLPQTQYPNSFITRPYDAIPLILFVLSVPLFWHLYKKAPSFFTMGLLLDMLPEIVLETHMAFGSSSLFDNHFNIAHFLKVIAYLVPLMGLLLDYIQTHGRLKVEITEKEKAQKAQEKLVDKLTDSNEELERFAYVCSHDLQEPLRMIRSFSGKLEEHLCETLEGDKKGQRYLGFVTDGAERAQSLIADILAYSSLDNDTNKAEPINMTELVNVVKEIFQTMIEVDDSTITYGDLPLVLGNKSQLYQLLQNLINNGLKYKKDNIKPYVHVSAKDKDHHWEFSVRDNGIGMEERHLKKIFDVFQRLHRKEQYQGTGVGLAICKKIVERHHGKIWVESEKGEGSTFFFTIPKTLLELN